MIIFQGDGFSVTLPNPDYPNSHVVNVKTKFKHAMNGRIYSTRFTPASDSYILPIKGIYKNRLEELVAFMIATKGKLVQFIDENDISKIGYIINDPLEFTNTNELAVNNTTYTYDVEITFEEAN